MNFRNFDPTRLDPPNLPKIPTRPDPARPAGRPDPCVSIPGPTSNSRTTSILHYCIALYLCAMFQIS